MTVVEPGATVEDGEVTVVRPAGTVETKPLSALTADRPVLLAFYTADFSDDCIAQWCAFRDLGWFLGSPRLRVVGSSRSDATTHRRFIEHLDLGFPLVADTDRSLAEAFGVSHRSRRSCFLVDEDLVIRHRWLVDHRIDSTRSAPPVREIHEDLNALLGLPSDEFAPNAALEV